MIARIWHGKTRSAEADQYLAYLQQTGLPDYRATPGNRGVYLLRRIAGDQAHFLLMSLWESLAAVENFAGADIEQARYYPADEKFLLELEPHVQHFEILVEPARGDKQMSEITAIIDEVKRIHAGDAWHGPALRDLLTKLTPQQAAARPLENAHSIWELVQHIAGWETVFRRRLEGEPVTEPEAGDFPAPDEASEPAWRQALADLDASHEKLLGVLARLSDAKLGDTVTGVDYTVGFLLRGLVRHNVYHAGQIALLGKAFV